jgi:hypothetical protein
LLRAIDSASGRRACFRADVTQLSGGWHRERSTRRRTLGRWWWSALPSAWRRRSELRPFLGLLWSRHLSPPTVLRRVSVTEFSEKTANAVSTESRAGPSPDNHLPGLLPIAIGLLLLNEGSKTQPVRSRPFSNCCTRITNYRGRDDRSTICALPCH